MDVKLPDQNTIQRRTSKFYKGKRCTIWDNYQPSIKYVLQTSKKNWDDARFSCELRGMRLAQIRNEREWKEAQFAIQGQLVWIGASDRRNEGSWLYTDHSPVTFEKLIRPVNKKQPKNDCLGLSSTTKDEDCAAAN